MLKIALTIVAVAAAASVAFISTTRHSFVDGDGMINTRDGDITAVSYSSGGGMDGGYTYYHMAAQENGTVIFEYETMAYNGAEEIIGKTEIPSCEQFDQFREICRRTHCLLLADKGKPSEFQLLDAPVDTITFYLGNETVTFKSNYDYSEKCNGLFSDVVTVFEQLLPQNNPD